jgi:transposase-like protein
LHRVLVRSRSRGDTGVMIHLQSRIDDAKCFETVRALRWPAGVCCPSHDSFEITQQGRDDTQPGRQRYLCQFCERRFDALTDTIVAGHQQPLRVWILCLYCMGLHLSNHPMAQELDRNKDDAHQMTSQLRQGMVRQKPSPTFTDEVACDEVYMVAGHKGKPDAVEKRAARPAQTTPRHTRTRHPRHGEAPDLWDDPAWWRGGDSDAGKRPTTDDQTPDQSDQYTRSLYVHGCVRHV